MASQSAQIILAKRPATTIVRNETFQSRTVPTLTESDLSNGQVLAETIHMMLEPIMRCWTDGLILPIRSGEVMKGSAILRAIASRSPGIKPGDLGMFMAGGWSAYAVIEDAAKTWDPIDVVGRKLPHELVFSDYAGFFGLTGLTGYFGVTRLGMPRPGVTYVVSTAAGVTGSTAAQVAKIMGARVILSQAL
jgi:NADPH-dependent curcumin reductase CurA